MTDLGTSLALEDDAFATTANAATATAQIRVLVSRAVHVVLIVFIHIFGVVCASDNGRGSCCGATAVERGDERWRQASCALNSDTDDSDEMAGDEEGKECTGGTTRRTEAGTDTIGGFDAGSGLVFFEIVVDGSDACDDKMIFIVAAIYGAGD